MEPSDSPTSTDTQILAGSHKYRRRRARLHQSTYRPVYPGWAVGFNFTLTTEEDPMYLTSFAPVPEPSSAIPLSIALLGVAFVIHKRQAVRNFSSAAMMRAVARDRRVAVQYVWLCVRASVVQSRHGREKKIRNSTTWAALINDVSRAGVSHSILSALTQRALAWL
jgi:hypothetical protein